MRFSRANPSANVFVLGDFNVHHKDWITYSGGTDRPGELYYNFSISKNLTQMVNFPTLISDCDSHSPALLHFFLSSDASICSTMAFPPEIVHRNHFFCLYQRNKSSESKVRFRQASNC